MRDRLRIVDTFCGCGGFALGAHQAGMSPGLSIDIDPILTSSIALNFPQTNRVLADLSDTSGRDIEAKLGGRVDGVFGGPPCQGFSTIGRRQVDDPRRSLLGHYFRLVSELSPAFFVMENVQGLTYADSLPLLEAGLGLLGGRYELVGPVILDSSEFGAATKRPRVFVIGYDQSRCDPISLTDIDRLKVPATTVFDAISDLQSAKMKNDENGYDVWELPEHEHRSKYAKLMISEDRTFTGHKLTRHSQVVEDRFKALPQGSVDRIGRHYRLSWTGLCPTLRAGTGSEKGSFQSVRPIHPDLPRVITVREAARLQGFPDAFRFHPTVWHSFRMIGNSVSPVLARALFTLIAQKMGISQVESLAAE